jgi:hypothetical protein
MGEIFFGRHIHDNLTRESGLEGAKLARLYLPPMKGVASLD